MISDTDLPKQPDTIQPPVIEEKSNPIWKVVFTLLLIGNLVFLGFWLLTISINDGLAFIAGLPFLFILVVTDLITVVPYIIKKHPHDGHHGITRIIADTALILIVLVLILATIFIYGFRPR